MTRLQFKKEIKAPVGKVYKIMLGLDDIKTYENWTAEFNPTSTYEGNWEKGSKMRFVGTDKTGKKGGMLSEVAENIPNRFVSVKHYGVFEGEEEITTGPAVEGWAGGLENYSFEEKNDSTIVTVDLDGTEDHIDYFKNTFPKALEKLKQQCEQ